MVPHLVVSVYRFLIIFSDLPIVDRFFGKPCTQWLKYYLDIGVPMKLEYSTQGSNKIQDGP